MQPELLSSGHGLLEAPVFDPEFGLIAADASHGGVWAFPSDRAPRLLVPHRRGIGGMAVHARGGFVVSGRNVAIKMPGLEHSDAVEILANDPARGVTGFNDMVTDRMGRVYVGSLAFFAMDVSPSETGEKPAGRLHLIDLDGSVRDVAQGVLLSNGLAFSPDGKRLYFADSLRRIVSVFNVSDDGSLANQTTFCKLPDGLPDGIAVTEDGSVWLAVCHGGRVIAYDQNGEIKEVLTFPVPMITSLCFGGEDYRDLYIVSGPTGAPPELSGCVFRQRVDVPGIPRPRARIAFGKDAR
jgi:D-xylonolactonase